MTPLADALAQLARLLPERVRELSPDGPAYAVWLDGYWQYLVHSGLVIREGLKLEGQWRLEYALREECAARGWELEARIGFQITAQIWPNPSKDGYWAEGDTPAHALALALLTALQEMK